jgi:hypothetical protein
MPIPTYTPGYPPDGSSLGQTKATIRNNLDGTFETLGIDHVNNNGQPGSQPAGYHTIIHQVPQTSVNTVSGYYQLFSGIPGTLVVNSTTTPAIPNNGDTQLYSLTGAGALSQMSGSGHNSNGYVWISGILLQWGTGALANQSSSVATVSFNNPDSNYTFPKNCFNVHIGLIGPQANTSGNAADNIYVVSGSISTTGFEYQFNRGSTKVATSFFWLAIGN